MSSLASTPGEEVTHPPWPTGESHEARQLRYAHLKLICQQRQLEELKSIISRGWSINECFYTNPWAEDCQHALNIAVWYSWAEGVKTLLAEGAVTDKASPDCSPTPLIPDAVINFFNVSMEIENDRTKKRCPIKAREIEQNLEIIRRLIRAGCDVNRAGDDGLPLLHIAAQCPDTRVLRMLLGAGAKVNVCNDRASARGRSPLTKAVEVNNIAAFKLLLQYGADVNIRCRSGTHNPTSRIRTQSLFERCLDLEHYDIAMLLVRAGCDITFQHRVLVNRKLSWVLNSDSRDDGWETEEEEELVGEVEITSQQEEDAMFLHGSDLEKQSLVGGSKPHSMRNQQISALQELRDFVTTPLPLKCLSRRFVRQKMCLSTPSQVKSLSIPRIIKEYIICRDM